ncbi:carotenoid biosynthesis protein [Paenalkalicoccus suaedae]|uniref:Carotenoid biosynthesis protein n=1 Tax=Paenalkalicoccus suaedae TaxID=2592382 RepID=A0A859FE72_9BACI|nr:carotenoid biosynthesis protein [Paenalkalicoccus suaedae]QKS71012.1 carotenoid biosynthesis protein [Paenalkalicoccus suaedae]
MPSTFDLYLFRFFLVWYGVGVILLSFDLVPPWLEWANVVFLITAGLLAMVYLIRSQLKIVGVFLVILIFALSMAIESFGVHTGLFFGDYSYQADFGPKVIGVPITIGFAWVMVIATSHVLAAPIIHMVGRFKRLIYTIYGALIATSLDLIIDPVAYDVKQYWVWNEGGLYYDIPFSNFYGWFILSFVLHGVISLLVYRGGEWRNRFSEFWRSKMVFLYVAMALMFVIVALVNGLVLAPIVSVSTVLLFVGLYFLFERKLAR